jgi:3-hydroxybutyrate dehydrogenase
MTLLTSHLQGKGALITGSNDGLGLSIAESLAACGCHIVLHGLVPEDAMADKIQAMRARFDVAVHYVRCNLIPEGRDDPVAALIEQAVAHIGRIDILVNNAVIRHFAAIDDFSLRDWNDSLAVNVTAAFRATQLVIPAMRMAHWGRIFNMTSVYGSRAVANRVDYVTTKTALLGLTRSIAVECIADGITCNAICPGSVLTPNIDERIKALMEEHNLAREAAVRRFLQGKQPNGELVEATHVAEMVAFLCTPAGNQITGAMMPIEGGWLAGS